MCEKLFIQTGIFQHLNSILAADSRTSVFRMWNKRSQSRRKFHSPRQNVTLGWHMIQRGCNLKRHLRCHVLSLHGIQGVMGFWYLFSVKSKRSRLHWNQYGIRGTNMNSYKKELYSCVPVLGCGLQKNVESFRQNWRVSAEICKERIIFFIREKFDELDASCQRILNNK